MPSRDSVRREFDRLSPEYDERWSSYVEASVRETVARLELEPGERLLDIGCGTGALLEAVSRSGPDLRLVGVDLSRGMLEVARSKLGGSLALIVADAPSLPLAVGAFDVVVSSSSLHYWPDPPAALAEIARVLRPGGRLVLTDWCDDYFACKVLDIYLRLFDPAHARTYGSRACERLLGEAGFREVTVERYRIDWPWGLMTAQGRA